MEKKNWIQDAVKHKGALRKEAKREHLIEGDEKLSMADLNKLEKKGGKTAKRAVLAKTLRKFYGGGEPDEDYQILIFGEERPEPEEESEEPDYYDDYAKGGKVLDLKEVYDDLRSKVGRLQINEENKDFISCDIRDWGNWEHDYEDYERDEEDFEDDDSMILSRDSEIKMDKIVNDVKAKYPNALIRWSTSEKNYIDFQISRKMADGGMMADDMIYDIRELSDVKIDDNNRFETKLDSNELIQWAKDYSKKNNEKVYSETNSV
jgi:hypothetical protein